jgi:hypothetical protein
MVLTRLSGGNIGDERLSSVTVKTLQISREPPVDPQVSDVSPGYCGSPFNSTK